MIWVLERLYPCSPLSWFLLTMHFDLHTTALGHQHSIGRTSRLRKVHWSLCPQLVSSYPNTEGKFANTISATGELDRRGGKVRPSRYAFRFRLTTQTCGAQYIILTSIPWPWQGRRSHRTAATPYCAYNICKYRGRLLPWWKHFASH